MREAYKARKGVRRATVASAHPYRKIAYQVWRLAAVAVQVQYRGQYRGHFVFVAGYLDQYSIAHDGFTPVYQLRV
jgi:hypothetical protein